MGREGWPEEEKRQGAMSSFQKPLQHGGREGSHEVIGTNHVEEPVNSGQDCRCLWDASA